MFTGVYITAPGRANRAKMAQILLAVSTDFESGVDENDELTVILMMIINLTWKRDWTVVIKTKNSQNHKRKQDDETILRNLKVTPTQIPKNIDDEQSKTEVTDTQKSMNLTDEQPTPSQRMKRQPQYEDRAAAEKRHLSYCFVSGNIPRKEQYMEAVAAEPMAQCQILCV